ncbi:hypothetical protein [Shewanella sp. CG12_big_fil_rev_8_21_14_0_65_47_15]|uniref:hypothetical protein n=1 Tax=Shewanella sp. CG12_big_fil_rev_8_21_14_0_65_47_15 TaxID=1975537 RepID=UPI0025DC94FB|nr:hypothetical protein [Shewanella sp. CG12_big_fil_rev_8_21_14_0_65_47_15]
MDSRIRGNDEVKLKLLVEDDIDSRVRGNDRKEKDYGTLASSLTVRAQPVL